MNPAGTRASRLGELAARPFDVLILGGGIYGATLACESARAGYRTALVEKDDYGGAASANSLKILHGGLRYLQQADIPRMRESIRSRREGLTALPYLTRRATFLAPVGRGLKRSLPAYAAAALLNDAISFDRNRGVPPDRRLPPTRALSRSGCRRLLPERALDAPGALCWGDGFIENTERYTLAYVLSAREAGAVTLNYARATRLLEAGGRVIGAQVSDSETGNLLDVRAGLVVDATSGWSGALWPAGAGRPPGFPRVLAFNLVARRRWFGEFGVGLDAADPENPSLRRNFFFMPWRGGTMIGTVYKLFDGDPDRAGLSPEEIENTIRDVNTLYPAARLEIGDVTFAHAGILPARVDRRGRAWPEPSGEAEILDLRDAGSDGFVSLRGVKYTTAAWWARKTVRLIGEHLGARDPLRAGPLYGAETDFPAPAVLDAAARAGWTMPPAMAAWLADTYGARAREVTAIGGAETDFRAAAPGSELPLACVAHAVRREDARTLGDVVFRRTDLATFAFPGRAALNAVAEVMAADLAWDPARVQSEIARTLDVYRRLGLRIPTA